MNVAQKAPGLTQNQNLLKFTEQNVKSEMSDGWKHSAEQKILAADVMELQRRVLVSAFIWSLEDDSISSSLLFVEFSPPSIKSVQIRSKRRVDRTIRTSTDRGDVWKCSDQHTEHFSPSLQSLSGLYIHGTQTPTSPVPLQRVNQNHSSKQAWHHRKKCERQLIS